MVEEEQCNLHKLHFLDFLGKKVVIYYGVPSAVCFFFFSLVRKHITISKKFLTTYKLLHSIKNKQGLN